MTIRLILPFLKLLSVVIQGRKSDNPELTVNYFCFTFVICEIHAVYCPDNYFRLVALQKTLFFIRLWYFP